VLAATLLAVGSAFVHATWNLLIKSSDDRAMAGWGQFLVAGLLGGVGLLVVGGPGWDVLPYLAASALIHVVYVEGLVAAYVHGDFSLTYPLARGGGAVLAALGSVVLLDDELAAAAWVAIAIAAGGLFAMSSTADVANESRALAYAAITALAIGAYTLVDSDGSRSVESGVSYGLATAVGAATATTVNNLLRPSRRARAGVLRRDWKRNLVGGAATLVAYTMVLVAVREAPVGYVTMLRESSVVIGPILGWLILREPLGRRRIVPSAIVLAGLVLLVAVET
jgi:drug/metabolite transporter (DMT)-like permease